MKGWIWALLYFVTVGIVTILVTLRNESESAPSLADKINTACKQGYVATDWMVTDEYTAIPPGVVMVTWESKRENEYGLPMDNYAVAVER